MKVLFVLKEKPDENLFVYSLRDALISEGIEAKCSVEDFWYNYEMYDIIHFHWLIGHIALSTSEDVYKFINQIIAIRTRCKIVVTCHDLKPHLKDTYLETAMNYIYDHCDAMIHLGKYSFEYFTTQLNIKVKHYIIPHHIYNNFYKFSLDKLSARKQLKIPSDANVLLCFGIFRTDIERNMVLNAWKKVDIQNKYLLAPRFYHIKRIGNPIFKYILKYIYIQVVKVIYSKMLDAHFKYKYIPHNNMETYMCAADVLMMQRATTLNSGNLSLGFHAKKVVIGPNIGNIREVLEKTGNPIFDPNDIPSITEAIQEGFRLKDTDLPQKNYNYAMKNWNVFEIARKHIELYQDIL